MKKILGIFLCLIILNLVLVQAIDPPAPGEDGKVQEKIQKVLSNFEKAEYIPGKVIIAFTEETTEAQANEIVKKFDLEITTNMNCITVGTGGPGEQPKEWQECTEENQWNEQLKTAIIDVPKGEEETVAVQIVQHEQVLTIEPMYLGTATGESQQDEQRELAQPIYDNVFKRAWNWIISLFH